LYNKAVETAARDHVSVEEFVSVAVANRLASREYIESRAKLFSRDEFERALAEIPDVEPEVHDVVSNLTTLQLCVEFLYRASSD
jgi:hypothetical protein